MTSYRERHLQKGADYSASFSELPHRAVIWSLERALLHRVLTQHFSDRPVRYLDFATGTGRILCALEPRVETATGVDISASMLEDARRRVEHAELIEVDLTEDDVLGERRFDLITSFRFFSNAEPALREQAMTILVRHLAEDGLIVFNNHHNAGSLVKRINRVRGRENARQWQAEEVGRLVSANGLEIVSRYGTGVMPFTDRHMPAPRAVVSLGERLLGGIPGSHRVAQGVIYVCRRV